MAKRLAREENERAEENIDERPFSDEDLLIIELAGALTLGFLGLVRHTSSLPLARLRL